MRQKRTEIGTELTGIGSCSSCKNADGPYPNGDRPKSSGSVISGCARCGWCY